MIKLSSQPVFVKEQGKKFEGNPEHLSNFSERLRKGGIKGWNAWYEKSEKRNYDLTEIDLSGLKLSQIDLSDMDLRGANFNNSNLNRAEIRNSNLWGARLESVQLKQANLSYSRLPFASLCQSNLTEASLVNADLSMVDATNVKLRQANLSYANLNGADLQNADLTEAKVKGISVWGIKTNSGTRQQNLYIGNKWIDPLEEFVADSDFEITTHTLQSNNLETAHLLNLIMSRNKLTSIINSLTDHIVLILGNFQRDKKLILENIASELIKMGYLPIVFDFPAPRNRDLIEMVSLLANISYFVIADISKARSMGLESMLIIPTLKVPFAPIIDHKETPLSMFIDLQVKYDWVLPIFKYNSKEHLIRHLNNNLVDTCRKMRDKIRRHREKYKYITMKKFSKKK